MYYVIWATDHPDSWEKRKAARPAHLKRVTDLNAEGRVLIAGPLPRVDSADPEAINAGAGMSGSLLVVEFDSLEAATEWANADPYVEAGVYAKVEVKPFIKAVPAQEN